MSPYNNDSSLQVDNDIFNASCKKSCRTKLQDRFESNGNFNRSVLSVISLNKTRRFLNNTAERISKTFNEIRTTMGSFSQKFRIPTKRREILEEGPVTPGCTTPYTFSRTVLGRTPTKLYTPFGIDTPVNSRA